jgi:hypothetical protein
VKHTKSIYIEYIDIAKGVEIMQKFRVGNLSRKDLLRDERVNSIRKVKGFLKETGCHAVRSTKGG